MAEEANKQPEQKPAAQPADDMPDWSAYRGFLSISNTVMELPKVSVGSCSDKAKN